MGVRGIRDTQTKAERGLLGGCPNEASQARKVSWTEMRGELAQNRISHTGQWRERHSNWTEQCMHSVEAQQKNKPVEEREWFDVWSVGV